MIQRRQTLWLLLAVLAAVLSFMFPFVIGKVLDEGVVKDKAVTASSNFVLLLLTGISVILSLVIIFLYKDRKLQMKLCGVGLVIAVLLVVLYIIQVNNLMKSTLALFCVLPFIIMLSYFMAYRNIRKDENLVKSLDKLR